MATAVLMCRLLQTVYTSEAITARGAKDRICITHVSDLPLSSLETGFWLQVIEKNRAIYFDGW